MQDFVELPCYCPIHDGDPAGIQSGYVCLCAPNKVPLLSNILAY